MNQLFSVYIQYAIWRGSICVVAKLMIEKTEKVEMIQQSVGKTQLWGTIVTDRMSSYWFLKTFDKNLFENVLFFNGAGLWLSLFTCLCFPLQTVCTIIFWTSYFLFTLSILIYLWTNVKKWYLSSRIFWIWDIYYIKIHNLIKIYP